MKNVVLLVLITISLSSNCTIDDDTSDSNFIIHTVNPTEQRLELFWQDENYNNFHNFKNLRLWLDNRETKLVFAMNGGMYKKDYSPEGLYIENSKTITDINMGKSGFGNFYLKPNGIFGLTHDNQPKIISTEKFKDSNNFKFATQSGPLLLIDGKLHPEFNKGSKNIHIRNGVGILPNGHLIFAMSKQRINFFDFANFFKNQGCKNALYLDGFISRVYLPSKNWIQEDGKLGVIIAEIQK